MDVDLGEKLDSLPSASLEEPTESRVQNCCLELREGISKALPTNLKVPRLLCSLGMRTGHTHRTGLEPSQCMSVDPMESMHVQLHCES